MSATAALWMSLFVGQTALAFLNRSAWGVSLYMLTFFAAPHLWWWGEEVPEWRYALIASLTLMASTVLNREPDTRQKVTFVHWAAAGMALNATLVHFLLATRPEISVRNYTELLKFILLFVLMWKAIQTKRDFRLAIVAIALGAAYIGYEVTINERGYFSGGRLEGVGAPGADTANSLASLMLITLPLTGSLFVNSTWAHKLVVVLSAPLALNVLLLCNSRGAFLGLIAAGGSFLLLSRGKTRKKALQTLALGALALFLLLGDERILERFTTTFAGSEERDQSAASRIEFWKAGLAMLEDYPLGDGGGAFKYVHGPRYLSEVAGIDQDRSLHNGYLTEATSWGVQGITLQLILMGGAFVAALRTSNRCRLTGDTNSALIGICVVVGTSALLIHSMFGSFLGNEWGYWLCALMVRYSELYAPLEVESTLGPDSTSGGSHTSQGAERVTADAAFEGAHARRVTFT